jgi:hypothetical protein
MAYINARGGYLKFDVVASSDLTRGCQIVGGGTPVNITGASIITVVKDKGRGTVGTFGQGITAPATGEWTFKIPKYIFMDWEGEEMTYETYLKQDGAETQLLWGELDIYGLV